MLELVLGHMETSGRIYKVPWSLVSLAQHFGKGRTLSSLLGCD